MTFRLTVPDNQTPIDIEVGEGVFVLGANGTGKSALLHKFVNQAGYDNVKRISATRQTWFQGEGIDFSPSQRTQFEQQFRVFESNARSRYMEQNAQIRTGMAIYDLIDAENVDARLIAAAIRSGDQKRAEHLALRAAPIEQINELLALANIPVTISVESGDRLQASKNGSPPYRAAELSDGERNALLICAEVLTAKPGRLLIIDEPERHLHRSIISPLLSHLFRARQDCAFVVATHDLMLPIDNPNARVLLVRSCTYEGSNLRSWEADLLPADAEIDEELKQEIVGARRRIVFVEGGANSLDHPLYSLLFPQVSVRSKGNSREVQQAVEGVRSAQSLHWLQAFGIIDSDGRGGDEVEDLKSNGIFALPFYSVETIYYHPDVVRRVAQRQAEVVGGNADAAFASAMQRALDAVRPHLDRLAARAVEKSIRARALEHLPTLQDIRERRSINIEIDVAEIIDAESAQLSRALDESDWLKIATRCPVRESPALNAIARAIGFTDRYQYESAVLQMLRFDQDAIRQLRSLFQGLPEALGVDH